MSDQKEILVNLTLELRRGTLVLSTLSQLKGPKYGYALVQSLEESGIVIDASTLYPLLRRLEKQGLLASEWDVGESKPRKYYKRTVFGDQVYENLKNQWQSMVTDMQRLLEE